ncbi:MAG: hypothetical protein WC413_01280 [Candidatus Nanoarchaeia archaeon]
MGIKNYIAAGLLGLSLLFNPVKVNSQVIPAEEELEIKIQEYIINLYESQIHSSPENEKNYLMHSHPRNTPKESNYWNNRLKISSNELKEYEKEGLYLLCSENNTFEKMLKKGYLFVPTTSNVSGDLISILFGKVTKEENVDGIRIIYYKEISPDFEDKVNIMSIYGRAVKNGEDLIFINESNLEEHTKKLLEEIENVKKLDKPITYYQKALYKLSKKPKEVIEKEDKAQIIAHEVDHIIRKEEAGVNDEKKAYFKQFITSPDEAYLNLLKNYMSKEELKLREKYYKKCKKKQRKNKELICIKKELTDYEQAANEIFNAFEKLGYPVYLLAEMPEDEIRKVAEKIKF